MQLQAQLAINEIVFHIRRHDIMCGEAICDDCYCAIVSLDMDLCIIYFSAQTSALHAAGVGMANYWVRID